MVTKQGQSNKKVKGKTPASKPQSTGRRRGKAWGPDDISESIDQLKEAMSEYGDEPSGLVALRLRLLLLLKSGAAKNASEAQKKIGMTYVTVNTWLKTYREKGLEEMLKVGVGGREPVPDHVRAQIQAWVKEGVGVDDILEKLDEQFDVQISKWTIYKVANPPENGELWQCKTTAALDEALSDFAESRAGKKIGNPGGWYRDASGDVVKYNTALIEAVLMEGAEASLAGKHEDVGPRKNWGVRKSSGFHIGLWLTGELLSKIKGAKKSKENKNQTLRRLLEIGLIEYKHPPEPEEKWADQNKDILPNGMRPLDDTEDED